MKYLIKIKEFFSFIIFILTKYYESSENTASIAYESALFSFIITIYMNYLLVNDFINSVEVKSKTPYEITWLNSAIWICIVYILARIIFKKKNILSLHYDENKLKVGKIFLLFYIIISFFSLVIRSISKG